jgi:hypothetical protein
VDEQAFRFNNRLPMCDGDRFSYLVRKVTGKRLTYAELTGKTEEVRTEDEPFKVRNLPRGPKKKG